MRYIGILLLITLVQGCVKPYNPNVHSPGTGYLVVEGNLNSGPATTNIILSRSIPLSDTASEVYENTAVVTVEGSDGTSFTSTALDSAGIYAFGVLPLDNTKTYRLNIKTADGNQYLSNYVRVIPTPPIDSISNNEQSDGVHVYVNAHNPANNTHYYLWNYVETWEYHSAEETELKYVKDSGTVGARLPWEEIYTCWESDISTSLLLYSTAKLGQDVVSQAPLLLIPRNSDKLMVEYSVIATQCGLSDSAYNYLLLMQSNTENLGSIFDPLPSALKGNIQCVTDPSQTVVGFVNASGSQQKRVFINSPADWDDYPTCYLKDTVLPKDPVILAWYFADVTPHPVPIGPNGDPDPPPSELYIPLGSSLMPPGRTSNIEECIDCRLKGGSTTKPSFWP